MSPQVAVSARLIEPAAAVCVGAIEWLSLQTIEAPCEAPVATREYSDRMPSL